MIDETEFREMQEELNELRDSLDRLEAMNEAQQEILFATLQAVPVDPDIFADFIDRTLGEWLLKRRDVGSPSGRLLLRVRDDVLAKLTDLNQGVRTAKPRPALRAVPLLRPNAMAPSPEAAPGSDGRSPRQGNTPPAEQPPALHAPGAESLSEEDA